MPVPTRRLRWRVMRAGHWLDLMEERRIDATPIYVGLIDGREALRSPVRREAEDELVRLVVTGTPQGVRAR